MTGCSEHIFFKRRLFVELQDQDLSTVTNNIYKTQKLPVKYDNCSIIKAGDVPIVTVYLFPSSLDHIIFVSASRQLLNIILLLNLPHWGHVVVQLVEALRYKTEGRGFDS
jgi:hypothetical protein